MALRRDLHYDCIQKPLHDMQSGISLDVTDYALLFCSSRSSSHLIWEKNHVASCGRLIYVSKIVGKHARRSALQVLVLCQLSAPLRHPSFCLIDELNAPASGFR